MDKAFRLFGKVCFMCGFLFSNKNQNEELFLSRLDKISYRGPDFTGYAMHDNLHFGHLRLSILDLDSRSNQPMKYNDLIILYNGEIYNYQEIKKELELLGYTFKTDGDTEVLLIGFQAWGNKLLEKINGMFAFIIYNTKTKKLFGARDRIGVKPFYYYIRDGQIEICSQLSPLKDTNNLTLNQDSISMYLDCRFVPAPYSIYQEIKKLEAGHYLEYSFEDSSCSISKYWDLKSVKPFKGTYKEAKLELKKLIYDAVRIRLYSDVPLGSFLSGGIDSALVTSIASDLSVSKINTFTVSFPGSELDESDIARKYASILNSNHRTLECGPEDILKLLPTLIEVYDEPFGDNSALPTLLLNKRTKEFVTVALSGDGGDESFLGYDHYNSLSKYEWIMSLPLFIRKFILFVVNLLNVYDLRFKNALGVTSKENFVYRKYSRFGLFLNTPNNNWLKKYNYLRKLSKSFIQFAADVNIKLWLEGDSNVKVDRGSMASSVEVRSPFLDYRIIEFARSLPIEFRLKNGVKKRILRDILEEFVPADVFSLPKKGFGMPLENWIRHDLKDEILGAINDGFFSQVPNLNKSLVIQLLNEHIHQGKNHSDAIWRVFILSKWVENNLERKSTL
jgi:asparagine synthase (glutamine-hydrolysing)